MIRSKDKNADNPVREKPEELKTSLFGSVKGGDVTEKMIKESKRNLFRNLNNI